MLNAASIVNVVLVNSSPFKIIGKSAKQEFKKSTVQAGSNTARQHKVEWVVMKRMTLVEIKGNTPRSKSFLTKRGEGTKPLAAHATLDEDRNVDTSVLFLYF